jgi:long-chain acyl-CoA synthetase
MDKELDPKEIEGFLASVQTKAFVFSSTYNETFRHLAENHPSVEHIIPMSADEAYLSSAVGAVAYDTVVRRGLEIYNENGFEADTDTERCAEMLFTSGTTGTSKCVMLCQRNVFAAVNSACTSVDFSGDDVLEGVFVPDTEKHYTLLFWYDGRMQGLVRGVSVASE